MSGLRLSFACALYDRMLPLYTGEVQPEGIDLDYVEIDSSRNICESKDRAPAKMRYTGTLRYMLPWMTADLDEIDEVFGGDPWPYGVAANAPTLEALVTYMVEQSVIAAPVRPGDLFVPTAGRV